MGVASKCVAGLCTQRDERGEAVYIHSLLDSEVGSCVCMYVWVCMYLHVPWGFVRYIPTYLPSYLPTYLPTFLHLHPHPNLSTSTHSSNHPSIPPLSPYPLSPYPPSPYPPSLPRTYLPTRPTHAPHEADGDRPDEAEAKKPREAWHWVGICFFGCCFFFLQGRKGRGGVGWGR